MQGTTADFRNRVSYQEATAPNLSDRSAYIGTRRLKPNQKEKYRRQGGDARVNVEIGKTLEPYKTDIDNKQKNGENSIYVGCILYPERTGQTWSYEENQAFIAGIIDARRTVEIVTEIPHLKSTGTSAHEILWLSDNGYTFEASETLTIARPPDVPRPEADRIMRDYQEGSPAYNHAVYTQRFGEIRANLLQLHEASTSLSEKAVSSSKVPVPAQSKPPVSPAPRGWGKPGSSEQTLAQRLRASSTATTTSLETEAQAANKIMPGKPAGKQPPALTASQAAKKTAGNASKSKTSGGISEGKPKAN